MLQTHLQQLIELRERRHKRRGGRGELSYLAPLDSEKNFRPLFQAVFLSGEGVLPPPQTVKHHASQCQDRNNKYFILYIEFCINNKI